jgi:hypothetical protein
MVMKLLSADEPVQIDALVGAGKLSVSTGILLGLKMRELLRPLPVKCFVRKL